MKNLILEFVLLVYFINPLLLFSQDINIEKQLAAIQSGDYKSALNDLEKLQGQNPNSPSIIYLDALLTTDGKEALEKYRTVIDKYPKSKYADASLFQVYSYYYAAGNYVKANKYHDILQSEYPGSTYLQMIENKKADERPIKVSAQESSVKIGAKESYKFTIQAGAFLSQINAEKLKKTFKENGFSSEVKEKKIGGSNFFVVNVGKFKNKNEAQSFLNDLKKDKKFEGRIVSIE